MLQLLKRPEPIIRPARRPKPIPIALLYPESHPESQVQAEALLHEIQTHAQDTIGKYVRVSHLQRFYEELCGRKKWDARHWSVIGAELGKLTDKAIVKRRGKRFMAYKIPRGGA